MATVTSTPAPAYRRIVAGQSDVEAVCRAAKELGRSSGFSNLASAELHLICSELATNLLDHAGVGTVTLADVVDAERRGVLVEAVDFGPGIDDVGLAMTEGYTTAGGLGEGLPLARRLATTFEIESTPKGTRVVATKWS
jgi:serine/threonine-protein kinase RsbT